MTALAVLGRVCRACGTCRVVMDGVGACPACGAPYGRPEIGMDSELTSAIRERYCGHLSHRFLSACPDDTLPGQVGMDGTVSIPAARPTQDRLW